VEKPLFPGRAYPMLVTIAIMHVPVVEQPCQVVMGWIPALVCLLFGVCGCLRPCQVVMGWMPTLMRLLLRVHGCLRPCHIEKPSGQYIALIMMIH
jgi:hypothetical protein